jgi:hypothetical protein
MKGKFLLILIMAIFVSYDANALPEFLQKKYPYSVLTDDYGILNQIDLNSVLDGVYPPISSPKKGYGYIYWQCFPREQVKISLEDIGYSSMNHIENDAEITITAYDKDGVIHQYGMRRSWPVLGQENRFNQYVKLMQAEKYVCIAGNFIESEEKTIESVKQHTHYWVFEKMKTKKGCEAYFEDGCHYNKAKI